MSSVEGEVVCDVKHVSIVWQHDLGSICTDSLSLDVLARPTCNRQKYQGSIYIYSTETIKLTPVTLR